MSSNVGDSGVYEANEQVRLRLRSRGVSHVANICQQRTYKDSEIQEAKKEARYNEGKENAHNQLDSKDERSIANKLAAEEKVRDRASLFMNNSEANTVYRRVMMPMTASRRSA